MGYLSPPPYMQNAWSQEYNSYASMNDQGAVVMTSSRVLSYSWYLDPESTNLMASGPANNKELSLHHLAFSPIMRSVTQLTSNPWNVKKQLIKALFCLAFYFGQMLQEPYTQVESHLVYFSFNICSTDICCFWRWFLLAIIANSILWTHSILYFKK